ncbi:hypothetical protein [Rhizobium sp. FKL33]|uniref:hypothetical protein n=1 Tax=Rhizobium sp. FKL33 TaxID=2562307 RepID=UPI0010C08781|nr:hypothetical protein [Rhizobium sp. FKL33]
MPFSDPFAPRKPIKPHANTAFQDPLERDEWRGLLWLTPFLVQLTRSGTAGMVEPARKPRRLDVSVQTRSPFFTR